jgi:hypothetical protein
MLEAHRRYGNPEYLDAARRGGDFLLLAQLPEPQSAWAQQYNARMEPVWARAFEPPAVTAGESVGAVHILIELYNYTGDDKYLAPLPKAIDWWKRSELAPDTWARFYELGTNKPIYGDRDGKIYYRVEEISQERRTGYSWQGSYGIASALRAYEQIRRDGRKFSWTKNKPLTARQKSERAKTLEPSVRQIIATLDSQGRWITKGQFVKRATGIEFGDRVETQVFIRNLKVLCDYLSAASADRN